MSVLKNSIDYQSLEEELHAALAVDELYKLQNDAKIRAVEQGVPTYEHFRQMVNGAHLKPLEHGDMKPKIGVQWNPMVNTASHLNSIESINSKKSKYDANDKKSIENISPKTCEDFLQHWKTISNYSEKFTYVWNLRNILQTVIFPVEIPGLFLNMFIDTCLQYLSNEDDITSIVELLNVLSTCNRFDLTICFMTKQERLICEQLFQQLQLKEKSQEKSLKGTIVKLAAKYRINVD